MYWRAIDAARVAQRHGVEQPLPHRRRVAIDEPEQNRQASGRQPRHAVQQLQIQIDEARVAQQIARRIAGRGHLRKDDQLRAGIGRLPDRRPDLLEIGVERADREIQLREGKAHRRRLYRSFESSSGTGVRRPDDGCFSPDDAGPPLRTSVPGRRFPATIEGLVVRDPMVALTLVCGLTMATARADDRAAAGASAGRHFRGVE